MAGVNSYAARKAGSLVECIAREKVVRTKRQDC